MGGTTEEMMMPRTSVASIFSTANRLRKRTPYSSTVWLLMVATRQWAIIRAPAPEGLAKPTGFSSKTPSTVLVLPTSTTSSIRSPRQGTHTAGDHHAQTLFGADTKEALRVQAIGDAAIAAIFIHVDQFAMSVGGPGLYAFQNGIETQ